jgi:hypothetical protein
VKLAAGERIHLTWPDNESHFFKSDSGRRNAG